MALAWFFPSEGGSHEFERREAKKQRDCFHPPDGVSGPAGDSRLSGGQDCSLCHWRLQLDRASDRGLATLCREFCALPWRWLLRQRLAGIAWRERGTAGTGKPAGTG